MKKKPSATLDDMQITRMKPLEDDDPFEIANYMVQNEPKTAMPILNNDSIDEEDSVEISDQVE